MIDPIVAQLTQGITPEKIALTLAVGSAIALFPIIGLTTLLCFLVALALRLNQPVTQLVNYALWPAHVPVVLLCIRVGESLFGAPHTHFQFKDMLHLMQHDFPRFLHDYGLLALHAVGAWAVMAPFYMVAVYFITLPIIRTVVRLKAEQAAAKAVLEDHPVP